MIRTTAVLLAAAAGITFAASPATAAPAAGKDLCKGGEYASYVDPATNSPFASQGQCVSFVNGGGVLVHELTASTVFERLVWSAANPEFNWHPSVSGATPGGEVLVIVTTVSDPRYNDGTGLVTTTSGVADQAGNWEGFGYGADCLPDRSFTVADVATGRVTAPVSITDLPVCEAAG